MKRQSRLHASFVLRAIPQESPAGGKGSSYSEGGVKLKLRLSGIRFTPWHAHWEAECQVQAPGGWERPCRVKAHDFDALSARHLFWLFPYTRENSTHQMKLTGSSSNLSCEASLPTSPSRMRQSTVARVTFRSRNNCREGALI